jgi:Zn-dependent peptidase ImmA (M78 family)
LLLEAEQLGLYVYEKQMPPKFKGLYGDKVIWVNNHLSNIEKTCILAEELGHYHTSSGDILDQRIYDNRKQERRARDWAYHRLVPLPKIVQALREGVSNHHEMAEFLDVTEDFIESALKRYQEKYGTHKVVGDYTIRFEPLGILELMEPYAF